MILPLKAALMVGPPTAALIAILDQATGESIGGTITHSVIAGVFAAGGAWFVTKERVDRNTADIKKLEEKTDERFEKRDDRLDKIDTKLEHMAEGLNLLVGEARARAKGERQTRATDAMR